MIWIICLLFFIFVISFIQGTSETISINNLLKKAKKIGHGYFGNVYKYKDKIIKIQYIETSESGSLYYKHNRELQFNRDMKTLPETEQKYFMKLYHYDTVNNCQEKTSRTQIKKVSNICFRFVYNHISFILKDHFKIIIEHNLLTKLIYEYAKISSLLNKLKYRHTDMHLSNIGIQAKSESDIKQGRFHLVLLDYGEIVKQDWTNCLPYIFESLYKKYDLNRLVYILFDASIVDKHYRELNKKKQVLKPFTYANLFKQMPDDEFINKITKTYENKANIVQINIIKNSYYEIFHTDEYYKFLFNKYYKPELKIIKRLPDQDIKYILLHLHEPEKIMKRFGSQ